MALIDRGDFAGFTSQESSNLAWGGIKYMESSSSALVRKLCLSRNHLIRSYPSTVAGDPLLRRATSAASATACGSSCLGTWLYWLIGSFFTRRRACSAPRRSAGRSRSSTPTRCDGGFEYSDAYLHDNDARFVWNFVRGALDYGCVAANYVESLGAGATRTGMWLVRARDARVRPRAHHPRARARQRLRPLRRRAQRAHRRSAPRTATSSPRASTSSSTGSHRRPRRVLTFFADDGRLFFVIPMGRAPASAPPTRASSSRTPHVTPEDRRFVLDNINKRLAPAAARSPRPTSSPSAAACARSR